MIKELESMLKLVSTTLIKKMLENLQYFRKDTGFTLNTESLMMVFLIMTSVLLEYRRSLRHPQQTVTVVLRQFV